MRESATLRKQLRDSLLLPPDRYEGESQVLTGKFTVRN